MLDVNVQTIDRIESIQRELLRLWSLEHLESEIHVEFSSRLSRSVGRSDVGKKIIRLHTQLADQHQEHLRDVLCHELAHIADWELNGSGQRPHGPAWRELVKIAGCEPSRKLAIDNLGPAHKNRPRKRYVHRCATCGSKRFASTRRSEWRCKYCVEVGLEGLVVIEENI